MSNTGSGTGSNGRNAAFIVAVLAAVLIVAGVFVFRDRGTSSGDQPGADGAGSGAPPQDREDCTQLVVAASPEKALVLAEIVASYNGAARAVGGGCSWVEVTRASSGTTATALARGWDPARDGRQPDVWSPSSSAWPAIAAEQATAADQPDIFPTGSPSIAQSPLVIAMPRPMAEALGWPDEAIGWSELVELSQRSDGWGAFGHPEWGPFRLGKTNPNISTSGLNATVATYFAATGVASDLTVAQVRDPKNSRLVKAVESTVVHYGDTTLTFLQNLLSADQAGRGLSYISAVTVEEKSVLDYNEGNPAASAQPEGPRPKIPLVAVYPKEGTLISDSPWVVLDAPWVDEAKRAVAADLLEFVLAPDQQERIAAAGFRTAEGKGGPLATEANGLLPEGPTTVLGTPTGPVLQAVIDSWETNRKAARVLLVIDVSGSMSAPAGDAGATRLELAQAATLGALDEFAAQDDVGLWIFSSESAQGRRPWREMVPIDSTARSLPAIEQVVKGLQPGGGTGLFATVKDAYSAMTDGLDAGRINGVVLLTDGKNEHEDSNLEAVLRLLSPEDVSSGVRVFTIGYGEAADQEVLEQISAASRAKSYDASDPTTIDRVMVDVLSNF